VNSINVYLKPKISIEEVTVQKISHNSNVTIFMNHVPNVKMLKNVKILKKKPQLSLKNSIKMMMDKSILVINSMKKIYMIS